MLYLVFDARKASGYLFETRRRWLAHVFCVVADKLTRGYTWDYSPSMEFGTWEGDDDNKSWLVPDAWGIEPMTDDEFDWSEKYRGA